VRASETLRLASIQNVDVRAARNLAIGDKLKLEPVVASFNVLNRTDVTGVNTTAYTTNGSTLIYQRIFGLANATGDTIYRERQIQFA